MSSNLRNGLIAGAIIVVTSFLLGMFAGPSLSNTIVSMGLGGFVYFILQNLAGNRAVDMVADGERDHLLAAAPPAGQALAYVYREGFRGRLVGWDLVMDGQPVAQLKAPRFTRVVLSPGEHTVVVTPPGFAGTQSKPGTLTFTLAPDEVGVFAIKLDTGMLSNQLVLLPDVDSRAALGRLAKIPMVASTFGAPLAPPAAPAS